MSIGGEGVFLGLGVGDGSSALTAGVLVCLGCAGGRPLGVAVGEGVFLAARGGLTLLGLGVDGVDGPALGIDPETVRFPPVAGVFRGIPHSPVDAFWMPINSAALRKYSTFRFLTSLSISTSCAAARRSI
jgi:hypothetical protein